MARTLTCEVLVGPFSASPPAGDRQAAEDDVGEDTRDRNEGIRDDREPGPYPPPLRRHAPARDAEHAVTGQTGPATRTRDREMEVVYVHSRRQGLASESLPAGGRVPPTAQRDHDAIHDHDQLLYTDVHGAEEQPDDVYYQDNHTPDPPSRLPQHRRWNVTVKVNDHDATPTTITDPFLESEYGSVFEHYLRDSDRPRWSAESMSDTLQDSAAGGISRLEELIRGYGEKLLAQLELKPSCFSSGSTECQVYIVDGDSDDDAGFPDPFSGLGPGPGIHCLAWELLEAVQLAGMPKTRLRVTRISSVPLTQLQLRSTRPNHRPPSFAAVQADPMLNFHVLLVVARDFSRTGAERDPEPDLAQWPLMNVQRKLRSRLLLEVVRPGSREELEDHLRVRSLEGVHFHLVHFDLHGRIMRDEYGNEVPWLLFTRQNHVSRTHGYQVPQTSLAKADAVAAVLARYKIENVVLNACLSAYNRSGSGTSLAHIFLEHGICNVSAMWFYVHWQTVATYLDTFYDELLFHCKSFHLAAQRGREAIRQKPTSRVGREYQDFFLCVNYSRNLPTAHALDPVIREPSPAPSALSQGSTASNNSVKSYLSGVWKPSTPRLGDAFAVGAEPVMRMQLHLLELEYKLMTFRVVYASDLRRPGSKLNSTIDQMANMWLSTNLVDEVLHYKAKDFARSRLLGSVRPRERRARPTKAGYLQLLYPKPVRALRQTLHVVHDVDAVVAPGYLADAGRNAQLEQRRFMAQAGLQRLAERLHADAHSYLLFLGSEDAQWWRTYLQHLQGEWWVHLPWSYTVHSRYIRDVRLPTEEKKPKLGIQG
ncbi:hypothetical protein AK830_g11733 [Neonectria ditissima]|uniref:CHAT domain-containing protein n=1 Tax=Neonectria ditissima TaxID=78410 RepID=A0A0P7B4L3_9HYPO|nr:hypothetical protein AK830_g11733 [Neonectria ditissima]